jgi:acyl carrier protein
MGDTAMQQILDGLAEIVNEITGIKTEQVVESASFVDDLDIDSLSMVEVAVAAEEKFGVRIPDEALVKLKTVGDAVAFIQTQGVPA